MSMILWLAGAGAKLAATLLRWYSFVHARPRSGCKGRFGFILLIVFGEGAGNTSTNIHVLVIQ